MEWSPGGVTANVGSARATADAVGRRGSRAAQQAADVLGEYHWDPPEGLPPIANENESSSLPREPPGTHESKSPPFQLCP